MESCELFKSSLLRLKESSQLHFPLLIIEPNPTADSLNMSDHKDSLSTYKFPAALSLPTDVVSQGEWCEVQVAVLIVLHGSILYHFRRPDYEQYTLKATACSEAFTRTFEALCHPWSGRITSGYSFPLEAQKSHGDQYEDIRKSIAEQEGERKGLHDFGIMFMNLISSNIEEEITRISSGNIIYRFISTRWEPSRKAIKDYKIVFQTSGAFHLLSMEVPRQQMSRPARNTSQSSRSQMKTSMVFR